MGVQMRGEGSKFLGLSHLIFGAAEHIIFVGATVNSCDTHDFLQRGCTVEARFGIVEESTST